MRYLEQLDHDLALARKVIATLRSCRTTFQAVAAVRYGELALAAALTPEGGRSIGRMLGVYESAAYGGVNAELSGGDRERGNNSPENKL